MRRVPPKAVLLTLLVFLSASFVLPYSAYHAHSGEILVPLEWRRDHPGPYTIDVAVVVDEEWVRWYGAEGQHEAAAVLRRADGMFEPADIHLRLAGYQVWKSPAGGDSFSDLMHQFAASHSPGGADMVVALTAQYRGQEGGVAGRDRRHVMVKHHPYRLDRDAFVLAPEVGHALGLDHHRCPHRYCIMSDHAYDRREHWCPDHLRLLRINGGFFQYQQDIGGRT
ncbi:MAG: hypothetical protein HYS09_02160 [Chloroflexi bacterium]|nr:hypothetical protein [Chloroflexota bacterium]